MIMQLKEVTLNAGVLNEGKNACEQPRSQSLNETPSKTKKVRIVPAETYSRVVGYFRPVQNWNKGKQEEFSLRNQIASLEIK